MAVIRTPEHIERLEHWIKLTDVIKDRQGVDERIVYLLEQGRKFLALLDADIRQETRSIMAFRMSSHNWGRNAETAWEGGDELRTRCAELTRDVRNKIVELEGRLLLHTA